MTTEQDETVNPRINDLLAYAYLPVTFVAGIGAYLIASELLPLEYAIAVGIAVTGLTSLAIGLVISRV